MGGGGCTALFLSLCGISRARLPSHSSQSGTTCFPLAAIPNFPEVEVHDFRYQEEAEFDFEGKGNPLQIRHFKLELPIYPIPRCIVIAGIINR